MRYTKSTTVLSFTQPTPAWATWVFRVVFLLTTAATIILAAEPGISDEVKVKLGEYMKAFDFVVWGIARGIGVKKEDFDPESIQGE
jgi:hypothetical protein